MTHRTIYRGIIAVTMSVTGFAYAEDEALPKKLPTDFDTLNAEIKDLEAKDAENAATVDDISGYELYLGAFALPVRYRVGGVADPDPTRSGVSAGVIMPELRVGLSKDRETRGYAFLEHLGGSVENQMLGYGGEMVSGDPVRDDTRMYGGLRISAFLRYFGVDREGGALRILMLGLPLGVQHDLTSKLAWDVNVRPTLVLGSIPDPLTGEELNSVAFKALLAVGLVVTQ